MRRIGSSHRGLSTIVTAGIMLSAVAVLGSAVVTWSSGNLKSFETALSNTAVANTNKITESVSIENIAFCSSCGHSNSQNVTNVTLTNTGTVSVKITQIQLNSTTITSYYYSKSSPSFTSCSPPPSGSSTCLPATISPKQSYTVSIGLNSPAKWSSQKPDTITVTTARGSVFTTQAAPP